MNRAELGALRDAIDTILSWPDSVRDQIAQWLQTDAQSPTAPIPVDCLALLLTGAAVTSRAWKNRRRASGRY